MKSNFPYLLVMILAGCVSLSFCTPTNIGNDLAVLRLCNASSSVDLDTVNSVLVHRDMQNPQARTHAFKCFLHCLYVEYEWMDHDGGFKLHNVKTALLATQVPEHRIRLLLYRCTATDSPDPCERASVFTECFWSNSANETEDKVENPLVK